MMDGTAYTHSRLLRSTHGNEALVLAEYDGFTNNFKLRAYTSPLQTGIMWPEKTEYLIFSVKDPDGKKTCGYIGTVVLDHERWLLPEFIEYDAPFEPWSLKRSPVSDSYVLEGSFIEPHSHFLWLIKGTHFRLITPPVDAYFPYYHSEVNRNLIWASSPVWSPDGEKIAYISNRRVVSSNDIWIFDLKSDAHVLANRLSLEESAQELLGWNSEDGIIYITKNKKLMSFNPKNFETTHIADLDFYWTDPFFARSPSSQKIDDRYYETSGVFRKETMFASQNRETGDLTVFDFENRIRTYKIPHLPDLAGSFLGLTEEDVLYWMNDYIYIHSFQNPNQQMIIPLPKKRDQIQNVDLLGYEKGKALFSLDYDNSIWLYEWK